MNLSEFMLSRIHKAMSDNREFYYKLSEQADRIIVWLVGFSIASIALTISNENTLKAISIDLPILIVKFSCMTVILGILYRIVNYLMQIYGNQIIMNFGASVDVYKNPQDIPSIPPYRQLDGTESCEELRSFLKEDFEIEVDNIEDKDFSPEQKKGNQKSLSNLYSKTAEIYSLDFENEKVIVKNVLICNLGSSQKEVDRIFDPVKPTISIQKIYRVSLFLSSILFLITTFVFLSGFVMFLWKYMEK
ncbi:MAG TPA: hypothetical protein VFC65_05335 [Prolixibacteraceae bacterium]|nr:hypothetical protein [Prolixibacteraceae bacterium]